MAHTDTPTPRRTITIAPAIALICIVAALRIAYQIFFSPFDLIADEAHYWEWSRHLDWSYYSKGPGIAYLIRAATELFGDAEWAIRIVPAVAATITAICMTILARRAAPDSRNAPLFAALTALLLPCFQGTAMLATIDAPFLACWAVAILTFHSLDTALRAHRPIALHALAFGAAIGLGILAKYTMVLLLPGLLAFHLFVPPTAPKRTRVRGVLIVLCTAAILASPIVIWNAERGWPTIHHLLGHLKVVGSDVPGDAEQPWRFSPLTILEFVGSQIALVGPLIILMVIAVRAWFRTNTIRTLTASPDRAQLLFICAALPILIVYLGVSVFTDAEGNWGIPAYVSLSVIAAIAAARAFENRAAPGASIRRFLWNASLVYGLVAAAGIPALPALDRIPALEQYIPMHRLTGARAEAEQLADQIALMYPTRTRDALVMADRYGKASLAAYYLHQILGPEAPLVTSAMSLLGDRPSSYDFWPETNPRNPDLFGRDAILIGSGTAKWNRYVLFDSIDKPYPDAPFRVGVGYRGPREHPLPTSP